MSVKALLIGPGAGLAIYAVLYAINGWRAVCAGFMISLLILVVVLWSDHEPQDPNDIDRDYRP